MANTIVRVRLVRTLGVVLGPERVEPLLLARDRERVAARAVRRPELALEVRGSKIVRPAGDSPRKRFVWPTEIPGRTLEWPLTVARTHDS